MDYLKQTGKDTCEVCGYNRCFDEIDFHHIDPTQKEFHISSKWSIDPDGKVGQKIKDEIEKCFVVCYNCHRELHTF